MSDAARVPTPLPRAVSARVRRCAGGWVCLAAGALAACSDSSGPPPARELDYGVFDVSLAQAGGGEFVTRPVAVFFRSTPLVLPTSVVDRDTCVVLPIVTVEPAEAEFLNAGDSVSLATGGTAVWLKAFTERGITRYVVPGEGFVPYTPGATATFSVPGAPNGFPSVSITARTAEAFTLAPVRYGASEDGSIAVSWTPAGGGASKVMLALQYATLGETAVTQQVLCALRDDGAAAIPGRYVGGFRNAFGGVRRTTAQRWRTTFEDRGQTVLLVISTFEVTGENVP